MIAACKVAFLLHAEHGGGVARSVTEGAAAERNTRTLRDALRMAADEGHRVGVPAGRRKETAVHVERRARTRAAEIVRGIVVEADRVEIRLAARQQLGGGCGHDLVPVPFHHAEIGEVVAPVGLEAG